MVISLNLLSNENPVKNRNNLSPSVRLCDVKSQADFLTVI